ncbi:MAG: hypothetical protein IPM54_18230 [Polyangiaceae bacterium]|nr:hypothetical protein [Polyangiaceae bacterium]
MAELKALNPSAATLEVHCHPSLIPEHVKRFAVQRDSGHIVTDEHQDELRSYAPLASVFIEVNPVAPTENAQVMASDYGLSCPNMVNVDEPSSESLYAHTRPDARYLAQPPNTSAGSAPKSLPRIGVCARPKGITVNEWHGGPGIKGTSTITNAADYAKQTANATVIYYFDAKAPSESIWNFGKDTKIRCPGRAPIPYDQWVTASAASRQSGATSPSTSSASTTTTTPKKGNEKTTATSGPGGQGPPLSTFEAIAHNLAVAGALSQADTSGNLKNPNGSRHGIPGGKNVGGFSFPLLQAGVATLQILSSANLSPKSFIDDIVKFAKRGQRTIIKEADAKMMQVTDDLIKNHGQYEMAKGLEEMQTIMPFELGQKFTKDLGGKFQAHKIFERRALNRLHSRDDYEKLPSVILTDAEHKEISAALEAAWRRVKPENMTKAKLREIYQDVYKKHPEWLEAIDALLR